MPAFGEFLDHLPVEGREVRRLAAGHQPVVDEYLLVHPDGAGIGNVRFDRGKCAERNWANVLRIANAQRVPMPTLWTVWKSLPSVLMLGAMMISVS